MDREISAPGGYEGDVGCLVSAVHDISAFCHGSPIAPLK